VSAWAGRRVSAKKRERVGGEGGVVGEVVEVEWDGDGWVGVVEVGGWGWGDDDDDESLFIKRSGI